MDEQSIWKKEISLGRKKKPAPDNDGPVEKPTSIWKKEISFGRNKAAEAPEPVDDAPAEKATSIWKKEISLGRKKRPAEASADDSGDVEGSDPEPGPDETAPDEQTWTRAVSFGRKASPVEPASEPEPRAEEPAAVAPVADEAEVAADASGAVPGSDPATGPDETVQEEQAWTKAVLFSRKNEPAPVEAVADESEVDAEGSDPETGREEPGAVEAAADEAEVAVDASGAVQGPDPETGPEETVQEAEEEEAWTKAVSFSRKNEPAPVEAVADEPEVDVEGSDPETGREEPVAVEAAADEAEVAVDASGSVQGSDPETGPEETVQEAEEEAWTKAVSFSRKNEAAPVEAVADEIEVVADASGAVQGSDPETGPEETVQGEEAWTKAVSFNRKAEPAPKPEPVTPPPVMHDAPTEPQPVVHPPVPASELPALEPGQRVPFWKKDISFGGGKKREKTPKEKKQKAPKQPKQPKVKAPRSPKGGKRLVGLKIGASQLAAARVANNGSAELLQVAREPLEPGIVVGGELRDPDALAEALKEFFAKHKLPKKGVRLGIANNRIGVRTFDIAGITDQKQLTNAIRFRAQEALPIPIDEAVLDYQVLEERVDEDGQPRKRILLVVAYRELIDRYVDACKKAGIGLVGIDLEAFALLRALQAPQEGVGGDSSAALVAVAIGHERSTFAVSDGRVCEFTRVLEWGGAALNVAIARALDAAPSEVEGAKRALALTDEMVPESLTAEQAKKAREAMRRAIQTFARELVSSLQYYQNQPGSLGIGEIALTGGTAHLPGLAAELERLIGVRVRLGDPLARMKVSKKLGETEQIGSLAVAIGLGIED